MQNISDCTFNDLVEKYLGNRLPPEMAEQLSMSDQSPEAKNFILRLLQLMKEAGYPATSFTPYLIRWLSSIKTMLPSAWGGKIPPLTLPDRHKRLDIYVKGQKRFSQNEVPVFLDMGCGFPPVTTLDTANDLSDWRVFGVDYSFPAYIVYNQDGHYASFDKNGNFQYFQALMIPSGRSLYQDPEGTRNYFKTLFSKLQKDASLIDGNKSETVEKDGCRLIYNHVVNFETDNLSFINSDICKVNLPPAQAIRCMNVFLYFDVKTRTKMVEQTSKLLDENGIMIVGTNGLSIQSRYFVYENNSKGPVASEFAFSPDNLGHMSFMPWFTIHENDPEALMLAHLSETIRSDNTFWQDFGSEMEKLQKVYEFCWRRPDGFFQVPEQEQPMSEYMPKVKSMWNQLDADGYVDGAVGVLKKAGYEAWKNCAGDIAIKPLAEATP